MRHIALLLALFLGTLAPAAKACEQPSSVLSSPLILPDDEKLWLIKMGEAFIVSQPGCGKGLEPIIFDTKLREAKAGDPAAMDAVGLFYASGGGVTPQDWGQARKWLEAAAAKGSGSAQYRLGVMSMHGLGVDKDLAAARRWYLGGSQAGVAWASTNLAVMHLQGTGAPADPAEAVRLFELARSQGDPAATNNLAVIYFKGMHGGPADPGKAFVYAREAARAGNKESMRLLGYFHANGMGTPRDLESALVWASLAGARGDEVGLKLTEMVKARMDPESLKRANKRIERCEEKGLAACELTPAS